jgi:hypothetical protein
MKIAQRHAAKRMATADAERSGERRWGLIRLVLGVAQVFGASLGAGLLLSTGTTRLTLVVIVLTGLCTTASVLLFGGRHARPTSAPPLRRR